jgi:hypothetical protein
MVGQFSLEVNRKDEPAVRRWALLPSSKPAEMRAFYSGADTKDSSSDRIRCFSAGKMTDSSQHAGLVPYRNYQVLRIPPADSPEP